MNTQTVDLSLEIVNSALRAENASLKEQIAHLDAQLQWLKRQLFGKKSERHLPPKDEDLYCQLIPLGPPAETQPQQEEKQIIREHQRKRPNRNGSDALSWSPDTPVETTIIDVPPEDKVCKETGAPLIKIGEDIADKLAHRPGSYYIKRTIRPKYAHPQKPELGVISAPPPDSLLPKCQADDSLLAEIITKKFADHLPLHRISEGMEREGVAISRKLLSQWVIRCGLALKPLYDEMLRKILEAREVFIDESPVRMQAKGQCVTAYTWVLVGGGGALPPYRCYIFQKNRRHQHANDLLLDYRGIVHSDKYGAYEKLAEKKRMTWCPCWAHIRRKFFEAESGDAAFRGWVLERIKSLFLLEEVAWSRLPDERIEIRKTQETPIIDELIDGIKRRAREGPISLLPKSKLYGAIQYFLGLTPYIKNYLNHPFARLDNNTAERALRPLAIGRKNWLFFGSESGGEAGTILLSLVQTCRGLDINPREYFEYIFPRLMDYSAKKLHELLPDQWLVMQKCRI